MTNSKYKSTSLPGFWALTRLLRGQLPEHLPVVVPPPHFTPPLPPCSTGQGPLFPICNILIGSRPVEQNDEGKKGKA